MTTYRNASDLYSSKRYKKMLACAIFPATVALTRYILLDLQYYYPTVILCSHFLVLTLVNIIPRNRPNLRTSRRDKLFRLSTSFCLALSLLFAVEALLHLPAISTWLILLPVSIASEAFFVTAFVHFYNFKIDMPPTVPLSLTVVTIASIVSFDRFLDPLGLVLQLIAMVFVGLALALHRIQGAFCNFDELNMAYSGIETLPTLIAGIVAIVVGASKEEIFLAFAELIASWFCTLCVLCNSMLVALAVIAVDNLVRTRPEYVLCDEVDEFDEDETLQDFSISDVNVDEAFRDVGTDCSISIAATLTLAAAIFLSYACDDANWRVIWSSLATGILLNQKINISPNLTSRLLDLEREAFPTKTVQRTFIGLGMTLVAVTTAKFLVSLDHAGSASAMPRGADRPLAAIDVAVSYYDEPVSAVNDFLRKLDQELIQIGASPRFFIYNKGAALSNTIGHGLSEDVRVKNLPNNGREGETFLHHIIDQREALANHTLFVQAQIHNEQGFFYRLRRHFIPATWGEAATGFLALGGMSAMRSTTEVSSCSDARDWNSWRDIFHLAPYLFSTLPSYEDAPCTQGTKVLLTYKGQFLVSAARIRSIPLEVVRRIQRGLNGTAYWDHNAGVVPLGTSKGNEVSNPIFGHSVERLWSVLFGCNEVDKMRKCPTLLGELLTLRRNDAGSCQCLDAFEPLG